MIVSFRHRGLQRFFETGSKAGIQAHHAPRLRLILAALDSAEEISDMDIPGFNLHPLTGNEQGVWSVKVNRNWRVTFRFEDSSAQVVDYRDYH